MKEHTQAIERTLGEVLATRQRLDALADQLRDSLAQARQAEREAEQAAQQAKARAEASQAEAQRAQADQAEAQRARAQADVANAEMIRQIAGPLGKLVDSVLGALDRRPAKRQASKRPGRKG